MHFLWKVKLCSDPALAWEFRYSSFHSAGCSKGNSVKVKYTFLQIHSSVHPGRGREGEKERMREQLSLSLFWHCEIIYCGLNIRNNFAYFDTCLYKVHSQHHQKKKKKCYRESLMPSINSLLKI